MASQDIRRFASNSWTTRLVAASAGLILCGMVQTAGCCQGRPASDKVATDRKELSTQIPVYSSLIYQLVTLLSVSLLGCMTYLYRGERTRARSLQIKSKDLEQKLKAFRHTIEREDLYSALAHDLKSPILGANRVLDIMLSGQVGPLSDKIREMLLKLKASNSGVLKQVVNLLQLDHYSAGEDTDSRTTFDIAPMIREMAADFAGIAAPTRVKVEVAIDERLPVYGNRRALGSLFTNLIDNAVKHAPPDTRVDINGKIVSGVVTVDVTDKGSGIPLDIQPKIFQRFSLESPGERYTSSTGLGLYLSKKITEFHSGTISFQTAAGGGTTFTVTFPSVVVRRKDNQEQPVVSDNMPTDKLV